MLLLAFIKGRPPLKRALEAKERTVESPAIAVRVDLSSTPKRTNFFAANRNFRIERAQTKYRSFASRARYLKGMKERVKKPNSELYSLSNIVDLAFKILKFFIILQLYNSSSRFILTFMTKRSLGV